MYITVGCEGSTAIEFCAALPAEHVAKVALALGGLTAPEIVTRRLASMVIRINWMVLLFMRAFKNRVISCHLPVVEPPATSGWEAPG
jgi:hypothetical protein